MSNELIRIGNGISGIQVGNSPGISGTVSLVAGDNVTIEQSGQDITISADGGGGSALPIVNKLINGNFAIDQRNEGAAVSSAGGNNAYSSDMWFIYNRNKSGVFSLQRLSDSPPAGFGYYGRVTITTADATPPHDAEYVLSARVEGFNIQDFSLGTEDARNISLSFWVRSTNTGTYGVSVESGAGDAYVMNYTINAEDTWEYKTFVIDGNQSGTWNTTNGIGLKLLFDLGSGSDFQADSLESWSVATEHNHIAGNTQLVNDNGASIDFAGVQIQVGDVATAYEDRPFQTEFDYCRRFYEKSYAIGTVPGTNTGNSSGANVVNTIGAQLGTTETDYVLQFKITKHSVPTMTFYTPAGSSAKISCFNTSGDSTERSVAGTENEGTNSIGFYQTAAVAYFAQYHYVAAAPL